MNYFLYELHIDKSTDCLSEWNIHLRPFGAFIAKSEYMQYNQELINPL